MKKRKTKRAARARKTKRSPRRKVAKRRKVRARAKVRKARPKAAKRRKPTVRGRRIAGARPARVARPRAAAATRGAFPAAEAPPPSHMADLVAAALVREGASPSPDVVEAIAAVGNGYRKGPATDSPFGPSMDVDAEVAPELVHRYVAGDEGAILDRRMHRPQVRATVDMNLEQLGLGTTGQTAREALTSLALGSWDPATDEVARRNALAGFIVRWYRDGLG